jgi:DNA-binding transcriptional LysR family regulator
MSKSIQWDDQRIFLALVETGSLSAAARRLGVTHPTVRARLEALERTVGAVLFTRSPLGLVPTDLALELVQPARQMAAASDLFVRSASGDPKKIEGAVRLSVPEIVGVEILPRSLERLRHRHPGLRIEVSLSNHLANVLTNEVDIAIRTVSPKQGQLIVRRIARWPLGHYAAESYLARRGTPESFADLASHDLIGPDRDPGDLAVAASLGPIFASSRFVFRCDSHPAQLSAVRSGIGIAVSQVQIGDADAALKRVLPDVTLGELDVWLVSHENLVGSPRVRAVLDHLAQDLSPKADRA